MSLRDEIKKKAKELAEKRDNSQLKIVTDRVKVVSESMRDYFDGENVPTVIVKGWYELLNPVLGFSNRKEETVIVKETVAKPRTPKVKSAAKKELSEVFKEVGEKSTVTATVTKKKVTTKKKGAN